MSVRRPALSSMLITLRHQNIVQFYGVVVGAHTRAPRWLVMERADKSLAVHLQTALATRGGITLLELVDICVDVLEGLAYLHSIVPSPVIHRCVQPFAPAKCLLRFCLNADDTARR